MNLSSKIIAAFLLLLFFVGGVAVWSLHTSVHTISVNGTELSVLVADHALGQKKGLGGYTEKSLLEDGMLFRFSDGEIRTFWMKGMKFDLDIVWIANGRIVAIDRNVPAPLSRSETPAEVSSRPLSVDMVLELPSGGASRFGIVEGMSLEVKK